MIIVTLIYMFAVALFNLSNLFCATAYTEDFYILPLCQRYWTAHFYFFTFLPLTFLYFYISRLVANKQKRKIYICAGIFSGAYLLFQIFILTSKDIAIFLGRINSWLWSAVMIGIVVISFIYLCYHISKQND